MTILTILQPTNFDFVNLCKLFIAVIYQIKKVRTAKYVKIDFLLLETVNLLKLISRKKWLAEKYLNFHTEKITEIYSQIFSTQIHVKIHNCPTQPYFVFRSATKVAQNHKMGRTRATTDAKFPRKEGES